MMPGVFGQIRLRIFVAAVVSGFALVGCANVGGDGEGGYALSSVELAGVSRSAGALPDRGAQTGSDLAASGNGDIKLVVDLPPPPVGETGENELIAINDVLEVNVYEVEQLGRNVQVDGAGLISLPLIGNVKADGKSVRELESEIEAAYGKDYLQNPDVTIFVKESFGQRVTVGGEVNKPGVYPTSGTSTLTQVIVQASDFSLVANKGKVVVFRDYGTHKLAATYDVTKIREGKERDPRIFGGDSVVVVSSPVKVVGRNLQNILGIANTAIRVPGI